MENTNQSKSHAVFNIKLHVVFVTKYRRKTLTPEVLDYLKEAFSDCLIAWNCKLVEYGGEPDHVHLLIDIHPALDISVLINNLKTASARRTRNRFTEHIAKFYSKPLFWHRAYFVGVWAVLRWKRFGPMWAHREPKNTPASPPQRQKQTASARPPPDDSAHALMPPRGHLA